jgi:hypothetical protein
LPEVADVPVSLFNEALSDCGADAVEDFSRVGNRRGPACLRWLRAEEKDSERKGGVVRLLVV